MSDARLKKSHALLLLAALTVLSYIWGITGQFVCDDWPQIANNRFITSLKYLPQYFTSSVWSMTELEVKDQHFYRPLFFVFLLFNFKLWGLNPIGYHAMSIALNTANALLAFALMRRLLEADDLRYPLLGAALFAIHPAHSEPVYWISSYPDLLASALMLGAFIAYHEFRGTGRRAMLGLTMALFALGLLTKETAIVLPALILAYEAINSKKFGPAVGMIALSAAYMTARRMVLGEAAGQIAFAVEKLRILIEFISAYALMVIWPWPITYYFTMPSEGLVGMPQIALAAVVIAGAGAYAVRRGGAALLGAMWVILTLGPALVLAFNVKPLFAARYLYLPMFGVGLMVAHMAMSTRRAALWAVAAAVAMAFVAINAVEARNWRDDGAFYSAATRSTPSYVWPYIGLGRFYERGGRPQEALRVYESTLDRIKGSDRAPLYEKLGLVYGQSGMSERSMEYFNQALQLTPQSSTAYAGLGNNYFMRGDYARAKENFKRAFELNGANFEACNNLALSLERLGDTQGALTYYRIIAQRAPRDRYAEAIRNAESRLQGK